MSNNDLARGPSISRRQLLAGALAGGATLASLGGLAGVERAFAASPKRGGALRIGMIGGAPPNSLIRISATQRSTSYAIARSSRVSSSSAQMAPW